MVWGRATLGPKVKLERADPVETSGGRCDAASWADIEREDKGPCVYLSLSPSQDPGRKWSICPFFLFFFIDVRTT